MNAGWLGGLFDGEGSVACRLRPPNAMVIQISLNMTDRATIDEVERLLLAQNIRCSRTIARKPERKPYYMLVICSHADVQDFCTWMIPHTLTKRAELSAARKALMAYRAMARTKRVAEVPRIYEDLREVILINREAS